MKHPCAFLFPGQGAQYVGMGKDFYEQFSEAKEIFQEADDRLHYPLSRLIFEGPSEELTLTKYSQLAIFVLSIALLRTLKSQLPSIAPDVCAGLSLGEYSALVAAEKTSFQDALFLVRDRALYMHQACEAHPGTMRVVLGLDLTEVERVIRDLRLQDKAWIANLNCPGQIVIAGSLCSIEMLSNELKIRGAKRILSLEVSGAFHSGLMLDAKRQLSPKIEEVTLTESDIALVMNIPGGYVSSLADLRENLLRQVTGTVCWEKGIRSMMENGVSTFLEIGCGKTLSGMNRKIGVAQEAIFSLEKVADLEELAKESEISCSY
ncbi:MAG: ACP S-malonyltransferase [Simkania sp.]|nr:ACP S-malonyltransferase [Simkania sp.]